jgi:tetratricopeptide (TPR) repeat protein/TolB-like protein
MVLKMKSAFVWAPVLCLAAHASAAEPDRPRVQAVLMLPFANKTGDGELDGLGSCLVQEVWAGLARRDRDIGFLSPMMARGALAARKVKPGSEPSKQVLLELGRVLDATVLTGAVTRSGDQFVLVVRFIDYRRPGQDDTRTLTASVDDPFAFGPEVVSLIVSRFGSKPSAASNVTTAPSSAELPTDCKLAIGRAIDAMQQGQFDTAERLATEIIAAYPSAALAYSIRGFRAADGRPSAAALADIRKAVSLAPDDPRFHVLHVCALLRQTPVDLTALRSASRALEAVSPTSSTLVVARYVETSRSLEGQPRAEQRDRWKAFIHKAATGRHARTAGYYVVFGAACLELAARGERSYLDSARQYLDRAVEIEPDYLPAWSVLVMCCVRQGREQDVERCADRLLALCRADPMCRDSQSSHVETVALAYYELAQPHMAANEHDRALAMTDRGLAILPNNHVLNFDKAVMLLKQGKREAALPYLQKALERRCMTPKTRRHYLIPKPRDRLVGLQQTLNAQARMRPTPPSAKDLVRFGLLLVEHGLDKGAGKAFRAAIGLDAGYAPARLCLGCHLAKHGRAAEAIAELRKAVQLSPRDAHAYAILAEVLLNQGSLAESEAMCAKAIELDENHSDAYCSLGVICIKRRDFRHAIGHLKKAVALAPEDPVARGNLMYSLASVGQVSEAKKQLVAIIRLRPESVKAYNALIYLHLRTKSHSDAWAVVKLAEDRRLRAKLDATLLSDLSSNGRRDRSARRGSGPRIWVCGPDVFSVDWSKVREGIRDLSPLPTSKGGRK